MELEICDNRLALARIDVALISEHVGQGGWHAAHGYATALAALALEDAGVSADNQALGRSWVLHNQNKDDGS